MRGFANFLPRQETALEISKTLIYNFDIHLEIYDSKPGPVPQNFLQG
jgi:hypothetical protein